MLPKLKDKGLVSYIIPSPFFTNLYTRKLREYLLTYASFEEIVNFEMPVFADPTVHTCIVILSKDIKESNLIRIRSGIKSVDDLFADSFEIVQQNNYLNAVNATIDIYSNNNIASLLQKLCASATELGKTCFIRQCIKTGDDKIYVIKSPVAPDSNWKPSLRGKSIGRYSITENDVFLHYGDWLARNWKNKSFYETPKIAIRETGNRITSTLDLENRYFLSSLYSVYFKESNSPSRLKFLLGILNSSVANFFMKIIALNLTQGAFTKVRTNQLARLPIQPATKQQEEKIVNLVEAILASKVQLQSVKTEKEKNYLESKCAALDRQIDNAVYGLYNLTPDEIALIEKS